MLRGHWGVLGAKGLRTVKYSIIKTTAQTASTNALTRRCERIVLFYGKGGRDTWFAGCLVQVACDVRAEFLPKSGTAVDQESSADVT